MNYKILIADDDKELLKMLGSFLEIRGYAVETALNGAEALKKAEAAPDLILLDVNMPCDYVKSMKDAVRGHLS